MMLLKRIAAGVMAVAIMASLCSTAFAAQPSAVAEQLTRENAKNQMISKVTTYGQAVSAELANGSPDLGNVLINYGTMLAYMHWIANNGTTANGTTYTILEGIGAVDTATGVSLMDLCTQILKDIESKSIVPSTTDSALSQFNSSSIVHATLPGSDTLSTVGKLYGNAQYAALLRLIVQDYIDANILMIVAKEKGETVSSTMTYSTLLSSYGSEADISVAALAYLGKQGDVIKPYLKVYNQLYAAYTNANSKALQDEKLGDASASYNGTATQTASAKDMSVFTVSALTEAMYNAVYNVQESTSQGTQSNEVELDTSSPLAMISNMSFVNGVATAPTDEAINLTEIGYRIMAAGVVYDPFVSTAGNDFYMAIVNDGLSNSSMQEEAAEVIQRAVSFKKPLYFTEVTSAAAKDLDLKASASVGTYGYAMLSNLLEPTGSNVVTLFTAARGTMEAVREDSSTLSYSTGSSGTTAGSGSTTEGSTTGNTTAATKPGMSLVTSGTFSATKGQMTSPLMVTSSGTGSKDYLPILVGSLTNLLMKNASIDAKDSAAIKAASREPLFVNGLGDIVTKDNIIILPAIANPAFWNYDDTACTAVASFSQQDAVEEEILGDLPEVSYYPYNATMMNHYPSMYINANSDFIVNNAGANLDKWFFSGYNDSLKNEIILASKKQVETEYGDLRLPLPATASFNTTADGETCANMLPYRAGNTLWKVLISVDQQTKALLFEPLGNDDGLPFFPLTVTDAEVREDYEKIGSQIVLSCVRYISNSDAATGVPSDAGTFMLEKVLEDAVAEALMGTQHAESVYKSLNISYDQLVADSGRRFTIWLADLTSSVLNYIGDIDGVLSLKGPYENGFFTQVTRFIQKFYPLIVVLVLIILARSFMKGRTNLVYVAFVCIVGIAALDVYSYVLPGFVTSAYNMITNDIVEPVTWSTIANKAEDYRGTYRNAGRVDSTTGELRPFTTTITLAQLTDYQMTETAAKLGVEKDDITSGRQIMVDSDAGIFIQGDKLKMSVDKLFVNNAMQGLYQSQWRELGNSDANNSIVAELDLQNPYSIQLTEPYISLEAHYTPYCHIERSLMQQLNTFSNIFNVTRLQQTYADSMYKDSFMFSGYMDSGVFISPGDDSVLSQNIRMSNNITNPWTKEEVLELVHQYFDPQQDWLGLRKIFENPSVSVQSSVWGQMLQKQEYYNGEWQITEYGDSKFTTLIGYVNEQTKLWVLQNESLLRNCSDENAIKLTSLYATTAFTHKVSQFGYWLYPNYLDSSPIVLSDVLYGAMTSIADKSIARDGNVVNTIALSMGVPGLLMLLLIALFSVVFILVITYTVPALYALLGAVVLYRLSNSDGSVQVLSGYIKVTLITIGCYILFGFAYSCLSVGGYAWYGYLISLMLIIAACYLLFNALLAVMLDPLTLGDSMIKQTMLNAANRLTGGMVDALKAQTAILKRGQINSAVFKNAVGGYNRSTDLNNLPMMWQSRSDYRRFGANTGDNVYNNSIGGRLRGRSLRRETSFWYRH